MSAAPNDPAAALATAPALAFFTVATADGSLDAAEIARFKQQIVAAGPGDGYGDLFDAALDRLGESEEALDAATEAAGEAVLTGGADAAWAAVRSALAAQSGGDAARFAADVTAFAKVIAEAAGGFYEVGPEVTEAEDAAVARVAAAVGAEGAG